MSNWRTFSKKFERLWKRHRFEEEIHRILYNGKYRFLFDATVNSGGHFRRRHRTRGTILMKTLEKLEPIGATFQPLIGTCINWAWVHVRDPESSQRGPPYLLFNTRGDLLREKRGRGEKKKKILHKFESVTLFKIYTHTHTHGRSFLRLELERPGLKSQIANFAKTSREAGSWHGILRWWLLKRRDSRKFFVFTGNVYALVFTVVQVGFSAVRQWINKNYAISQLREQWYDNSTRHKHKNINWIKDK